MDFIFFWAGRPFPVILPHELLPWLMRNGAFPKVSCSDLASYWDHIDARSIPVGEVVNDEIKTKCHPLYIWGDDAQYNAQHEKVIVVVLGHVLDPNTYSLQCCWPLFCIREATWPLNLVDVGKLKRAMKKPNNIYIYVIYILYWLFFLGIMDHHPYKYTWVLYICRFFRYCSNVRWVGTYRFVAQSSSHLSEVLSVGFPTLYAFLEPAPGI